MEQPIYLTPSRKPAAPRPLPAQFAALSPFVADWALATETERNTQRYTIGMEAIVAFKDALLPQVDEVVAWLNQFELATLSENEEALTLMYLLLSLAEVAPAVEFYQQPGVIDGYDTRRFVADEDFLMKPRP
ncbi:hypothetical protein [Chitinasiproducens palmae]|uniref:Uncharacterized protein n=1 Tax=Chitinasiproducens palmae TaxID=1770053 RepID=A0A1H2PLF5_9BURK|nr:hypothetical protein [Chitinasiproducens palmae]SDV47283.1 hypothetical protein SAMN05216551_102440 [Chitinasiproducens palmae]